MDYQPDNCLDHVRLHLRVHGPRGRQALVYNVVSATSGIVPVVVALLTVADGMIAVVTGAFGVEADGNGRLVGGTAVLKRVR